MSLFERCILFPDFKWRRTRRDWRRTLPLALAALTAAETQVSQLGQKPPPIRTFRKVGRWLVAEDAAVSDPFLGQIFHSNGSRGWIQRLYLRLGAKLTLRSHAQAIFLKSNLRAFYPPLPLTIKVSNPARPRASSRIANEITSRMRLIGTGDMGPPRLHAASTEGPSFLAEELVDALPVRRSRMPPREIARRLLRFHEVNGIEYVPAAMALDIEQDYRLYTAYSSGLGVKMPGGLAPLMAAPEVSSGLVACALCHGDLTVTNLMVGGEKLFITDWEWAERTIVFSDAVRLATQISEFDACFLDEFNRVAKPPPSMLEPTTQFLLAAVHIAARRIARRSDFEEPAALRAYDARLKDRVLRIARLIERLSLPIRPVDSARGKK